MSEYGQFCPIAKSLELIGEKWSLLIIRELLMGGTRYNQVQRGLTRISPAVLTRRLGSLEQNGLIVKRKIPGQRGHEYFPTESCKELLPILMSLGNWGMRWTRENLVDDDYDPELLMLYLERSVRTDKLVGRQTLIRFHFTDIKEQPYWWLVVEGSAVEVCTVDPGHEVDVYLRTTVPVMTRIWTSEDTYRRAIAAQELTVVGTPPLTRNIGRWMQNSPFERH